MCDLLGRGRPNWSLEAVFTPHIIKIVVEVKISGLPRVLKLWLQVHNGMLSVVDLHEEIVIFVAFTLCAFK